MNETFQNASVYKQKARNEAAREWHNAERRKRKKTQESRHALLGHSAVEWIQKYIQQAHENGVLVYPEPNNDEQFSTILACLRDKFHMQSNPAWHAWLATIERAAEKDDTGEYVNLQQAKNAKREVENLYQALEMRESGTREIQEWLKQQQEKMQSGDGKINPKERQSLIKSIALVFALFAGTDAVHVEAQNGRAEQQAQKPAARSENKDDLYDNEEDGINALEDMGIKLSESIKEVILKSGYANNKRFILFLKELHDSGLLSFENTQLISLFVEKGRWKDQKFFATVNELAVAGFKFTPRTIGMLDMLISSDLWKDPSVIELVKRLHANGMVPSYFLLKNLLGNKTFHNKEFLSVFEDLVEARKLGLQGDKVSLDDMRDDTTDSTIVSFLFQGNNFRNAEFIHFVEEELLKKGLVDNFNTDILKLFLNPQVRENKPLLKALQELHVHDVSLDGPATELLAKLTPLELSDYMATFLNVPRYANADSAGTSALAKLLLKERNWTKKELIQTIVKFAEEKYQINGDLIRGIIEGDRYKSDPYIAILKILQQQISEKTSVESFNKQTLYASNFLTSAGIVPKSGPLSPADELRLKNLLTLFHHMEKKHTGGDYRFYAFAEDSALFTVLSCMGEGVSAANDEALLVGRYLFYHGIEPNRQTIDDAKQAIERAIEEKGEIEPFGEGRHVIVCSNNETFGDLEEFKKFPLISKSHPTAEP